MLPATVNARPPEAAATIAGAYAAHQARTNRGNTAYTQAAKTFLDRFPHVQDWAERPLNERLSASQSLRPFLTFLILTRRLQPGYDYLLGRKFSNIWREIGGTALEDDLTRYVAAAREQGYSERVSSAMASQIVLRLLVGSGRPLNDLTPSDFDDLALAGAARQQRTGVSWRHYQDTTPGAWQVLFHLGILPGPASSSHRLPTTERLVSVPEPLRDALVRYLNRKKSPASRRRSAA